MSDKNQSKSVGMDNHAFSGVTMNFIREHYFIPGEFEQLLARAETMYGEISSTQMKVAIDVIEDFVSVYPRVFTVRVDLRFPQMVSSDAPDMLICLPKTDAKVITRFFASLESQLLAAHHRKGKQGVPAPFGYIWVKEQDASDFPHYHLILLFNKDDYAHLGDYTRQGANNMATRIRKAWCSALGLAFPFYQALAHFPDNCEYCIARRDAKFHNENYYAFLLRMAYLFKLRTKVPGRRNFDHSRPIGHANNPTIQNIVVDVIKRRSQLLRALLMEE